MSPISDLDDISMDEILDFRVDAGISRGLVEWNECILHEKDLNGGRGRGRML